MKEEPSFKSRIPYARREWSSERITTQKEEIAENNRLRLPQQMKQQ
jgi:hypothetical protein